MELRSVTRCRLKFPVYFTWQEGDKLRRGRGFTRDISSAGVFFVAPMHPPVGATLQFEVLLPFFAGTGPKIRMQGQGRVLRVEPAAKTLGVWGFAASNEDFSLCELEEGSKRQPLERLASGGFLGG
jgi:hypothetical protein